MLAEIWAELLGLEKVGIYDNFFDLGGHSLLITQLLAKVRDSFQKELPLRRFFEAPNIAALAKNIEVKHGADSAGDRTTSFDINAEVVLDPAIRPATPLSEPKTQPACILLTGATGFLGAFLLRDPLATNSRRNLLPSPFCRCRISQKTDSKQPRILFNLG
ncbi:phosphopantetheine-binding protein [Microcoleus vaginatus]|uniref:phosphopantetheine-binding protein n=1 Tax=Microcoleus vaginatus TaxID=119532 RepID=UPI00403F0B4C